MTAEEILLPLCPSPPDWNLDWASVMDVFPWLEEMEGCPQEKAYHGEGDVLVHTRLSVEGLVRGDSWRELEARDRQILFSACLMHDLGKPSRTRVDESGRIVSKGHAVRGAAQARRVLMEEANRSKQTQSFTSRENVVALIRHHTLPLVGLQKVDTDRRIFAASLRTRCDHLSLLAEADARGRISDNLKEILERIELFREYCKEKKCYHGPKDFPTQHTRFIYFRNPGRNPEVEIFDDTAFEVVLMSGLPGAGKDHWIRTHLPDLPVVSLDALRGKLNIPAKKNQGPVVQAAKEAAKSHMRKKRSFIWNATNITRHMRARLIDLFAAYRARIRIVYVEPPYPVLLEQNRARDHGVPERVIHRLFDLLEVPDLTEAHEVTYVV
jgi:predicted kinase